MQEEMIRPLDVYRKDHWKIKKVERWWCNDNLYYIEKIEFSDFLSKRWPWKSNIPYQTLREMTYRNAEEAIEDLKFYYRYIPDLLKIEIGFFEDLIEIEEFMV